MDEPKAENHKENPEPDNQAPHNASTSERVIQNVSTAPQTDSTQNPQRNSQSQKKPSYWSKIAESVVFWLDHYWDAPRIKSKRTEIITVVLTFGIAIAAFWSACIFQSQLTVARKTMEAQARPWVGGGKIEVKTATFLVYPTNPIQARTQVDLTIDIPTKNVGNSPAFHVDTEADGTMTGQIATSQPIDALMEYTCGRADANAKNKSIGGVLFPNSPETTLEWPESIGVPMLEITEVHRVWVVVCIAYSETTSVQQLHHTKIWMASWPINGQPTEIRRVTQPIIIIYYSLPIAGWVVTKTEAD